MTNIMLNIQLYQKIYAEQEQYKVYLLSLPPAQILNHAGEYACRENILMVIESNNLSDARAETLLKSSLPLADVYKNGQDGNSTASRKKSGTQSKRFPVKSCELNFSQPGDWKGR